MSYRRLVLYSILSDLYPGVPIACGTTYQSIILYNDKPLVPEQTIIDAYPMYVQKYSLSILRRERQKRLVPTDVYGLADFPFPDDITKQAWLTYRQALRNITDKYPNPDIDDNDKLIGVTWPGVPSPNDGSKL